mmetsp:Transcript_40847/g.80148  ORF Transcript_40847/g.80148 Transcript_40847/m.80148 type:complete len:406 (-) Transcript_40847:311-1528(-)
MEEKEVQRQERKDVDSSSSSSSSNEKLTLSVCNNWGGETITCLVKPSTPFHKVVSAFCAHHGMSGEDLRFTFTGFRLRGHQTPADFDMEDGDEIDVAKRKESTLLFPRRHLTPEDRHLFRRIDVGVFEADRGSPGWRVLTDQKLLQKLLSPSSLVSLAGETQAQSTSLQSKPTPLCADGLEDIETLVSQVYQQTLLKRKYECDGPLAETQQVFMTQGRLPRTPPYQLDCQEKISCDARSDLIAYLDSKIATNSRFGPPCTLQVSQKADCTDYKLYLSDTAELANIVGHSCVDSLVKIFGYQPDTIVLRKVVAHTSPAPGLTPSCIAFHLDWAHNTLQVPLNPESDYQGARLVFADVGGNQILVPARHPGSVITHNNTAVHGVTALLSGVRYSLFLLDHGKVQGPR